MVCNRHIDPILFMCPSRGIGQHLTLSNALFAPEEHSSIVALEFVQGDSAHIGWTPVVLAEFMVTLHVQFVVQLITILQISQAPQVLLL